jgi:4-diphosphocytidyl-2-C-methyl-D-erythritol kinase
VRKQIPIASGLGGGSSDAATVLSVLNRLWGCGLAIEALAELGLGLGADVPLFVHGRSAMATGVGELLQPALLGERHYLLLFPGIPISTADLFADPGLRRNSPTISTLEAMAGGGSNDFEPVARRRHPELARLMDEVAEYGEARLSGTGSTVFLPMASREAAMGAASELKCRYNVRAVGGLDYSPLLRGLDSTTQG